MSAGDVLRLILVLSGVWMLLVTIGSLAKRKMSENFVLVWFVLSVIVILAGCLLRPSGWNQYISYTGLVLILLIFFCIVYGAYYFSLRISELMRKNQELAIQVSLLNQENERILKRISEQTGLEERDI